MLQFDLDSLRALGCSAAWAQMATLLADTEQDPLFTKPAESTGSTEELHLMRLTEVHRDTLRVHDGVQDITARPALRLTRSLAEQDSALAVGDWVLAQRDAGGACWVRQRLTPQTHLVRRDADGRRHPVVSNVDCALLVMGLDDDFNLRRLERYIALVEGTGVQAVIVLTKADQVTDAAALYARQQAVRGRIAARTELLCVDARDADTAARLMPYTRPGQTLVLLGSSGAGKSTLTNTLLGRAAQDTGAVREHDSRGKHTTTARSLFLLPGGACIIDTPGLRALRPDADERRVAASFGDIETLARQCRFRDCRHQGEPGCQVQAGVDEDRLDNYHKLLREARRDTMSALERQQQLAMWKARGREGRNRLKMKRGET